VSLYKAIAKDLPGGHAFLSASQREPSVRVIMEPRTTTHPSPLSLRTHLSLSVVLSEEPIKLASRNSSRLAKTPRSKKEKEKGGQGWQHLQEEGPNKGHCVLPLASMRDRPVPLRLPTRYTTWSNLHKRRKNRKKVTYVYRSSHESRTQPISHGHH
jgi:hypothetical protein